jgi:hypothetical protein
MELAAAHPPHVAAGAEGKLVEVSLVVESEKYDEVIEPEARVALVADAIVVVVAVSSGHGSREMRTQIARIAAIIAIFIVLARVPDRRAVIDLVPESIAVDVTRKRIHIDGDIADRIGVRIAGRHAGMKLTSSQGDNERDLRPHRFRITQDRARLELRDDVV